MFITEHEDGSVTFTGSFYRREWDEYLVGRGLPPSDEADGVPTGLSAEGEPELPPAEAPSADETPEEAPEQPAGNATVEEWRTYALSKGASESEVTDLGRNDLRDKYGTEEG